MKTQFVSALSMFVAGALTLAAGPALAQDAESAQNIAPQNSAAQNVPTVAAPTQAKPTKPTKPRGPGKPSIKLVPGLDKFFGKPGCIKFPKRYRLGLRTAQKEATRLRDLVKSAKLPAAIKLQVHKLLGVLAKLPKEPPHVLQGTLSSCGRHSGTDD